MPQPVRPVRPDECTGPAQIDPAECLRLLDAEVVGRVIFTDAARPTALPVTFVLDEEDVVFRTGQGSALAAATRRAVVAFEVDNLDPDTHTGLTVLGVGSTYEVTDPAWLAGLARPAQLAWRPTGPTITIAIRMQQLSGRRLSASSDCAPG